ncbi:MAG: hypothetical protein AAGF12_10830 [Myxococcota bacterium]
MTNRAHLGTEWAFARIAVSRAFAVYLVFAVGCIPPADRLQDRPCPCADGWNCDRSRNVCVEGPVSDASIDAGDGPTDSNIDSNSDGSVDRTCWVGECLWDGAFRFVVDDGSILNTLDVTNNPSFSPEACALYYSINGTVHVARRSSPTSPFTGEVPLPEINVANSFNGKATISPDGLELIYTNDQRGMSDAYRSRRTSLLAGWAPGALAEDISVADRATFDTVLAPSGLAVYFSRVEEGTTQDILVARRSRLSDTFGPPEVENFALPEVAEAEPSTTFDERVIAYVTVRDADTERQLYFATRSASAEPFVERGRIPGPFLDQGNEIEATISPDGCELIVLRPGTPPTRLTYEAL